MKRIPAFIIVLAMMFFLCACGAREVGVPPTSLSFFPEAWIIVILIAVIAAFIILCVKEQSKGDKTKDEVGLKGTIPGDNNQFGINKSKVHQKSLDMLYAEAHSMWSCPHCETLNNNTVQFCNACGMKK